MWQRVLPTRLGVLGVAVLLAASACTAGSAPGWSFGPAASPAAPSPAAGSPAAASQAAALPSVSISPGASTPASASIPPSATPASSPSPSPSAGDGTAGSPSASPSTGPSPTPAPPDPGEPGFIAGTLLKPRIVPMEVTDQLLFNPTVVTVQQGETITFRVSNHGQATHEFKIGPMNDVFNDLTTVPEVAGIIPGSTRTLTYTFTGTGPYAFACHAPGHFENGMDGFVNVVAAKPWLGTAAHPRTVVIRMDDHLEFVPTEVSVTPGETILFVLPNVGSSLTHEFQVGPADRVALDQADGQIVIEADKIEPLHVAYLTYTFGGAGPYAFACHEPGHYQAGMKGVIDLTP